MKLSDQIKKARGKSNLTCEELARRAQITVRSVHYYERDEKTPSVKTLRALSDATGVIFKVGRSKR